MSHVFYVCRFSDLGRVAGPFFSRETAETRRQSYPNESALCLRMVSINDWEKCSDYAEVGEMIEWKSSAGIKQGRVNSIDRDLATADPTINADYYLIEEYDQIKKKFVGRSHYLNSNAMKQLKIINRSNGVQQELDLT